MELSYDSEWEEIMYLTAGVKDFDIWENLNHLETYTLIIVPKESPVLKYFTSKKILKNKFITIKTLKKSTHLFPLENPQKKYSKSPKGKEAMRKARETYDQSDPERRRQQKRDYMRRKRAKNPHYCKWK